MKKLNTMHVKLDKKTLKWVIGELSSYEELNSYTPVIRRFKTIYEILEKNKCYK